MVEWFEDLKVGMRFKSEAVTVSKDRTSTVALASAAPASSSNRTFTWRATPAGRT